MIGGHCNCYCNGDGEDDDDDEDDDDGGFSLDDGVLDDEDFGVSETFLGTWSSQGYRAFLQATNIVIFMIDTHYKH